MLLSIIRDTSVLRLHIIRRLKIRKEDLGGEGCCGGFAGAWVAYYWGAGVSGCRKGYRTLDGVLDL